MGHEAAGEVVRPAPTCSDLQPGDRVTFDSTDLLRPLFLLLPRRVNLCDNRAGAGRLARGYRRHGAFAEYVSVPRRIMYRLPDNLGFEQAALIEAVSVAVHAVNLTPSSWATMPWWSAAA